MRLSITFPLERRSLLIVPQTSESEAASDTEFDVLVASENGLYVDTLFQLQLD